MRKSTLLNLAIICALIVPAMPIDAGVITVGGGPAYAQIEYDLRPGANPTRVIVNTTVGSSVIPFNETFDTVCDVGDLSVPDPEGYNYAACLSIGEGAVDVLLLGACVVNQPVSSLTGCYALGVEGEGAERVAIVGVVLYPNGYGNWNGEQGDPELCAFPIVGASAPVEAINNEFYCITFQPSVNGAPLCSRTSLRHWYLPNAPYGPWVAEELASHSTCVTTATGGSTSCVSSGGNVVVKAGCAGIRYRPQGTGVCVTYIADVDTTPSEDNLFCIEP